MVQPFAVSTGASKLLLRSWGKRHNFPFWPVGRAVRREGPRATGEGLGGSKQARGPAPPPSPVLKPVSEEPTATRPGRDPGPGSSLPDE